MISMPSTLSYCYQEIEDIKGNPFYHSLYLYLSISMFGCASVCLSGCVVCLNTYAMICNMYTHTHVSSLHVCMCT